MWLGAAAILFLIGGAAVFAGGGITYLIWNIFELDELVVITFVQAIGIWIILLAAGSGSIVTTRSNEKK